MALGEEERLEERMRTCELVLVSESMLVFSRKEETADLVESETPAKGRGGGKMSVIAREDQLTLSERERVCVS